MAIWDYYEKIYDKLWVQRFSLKPTRTCILDQMSRLDMNGRSVLDMGCGTGQLLQDIKERFPFTALLGVEPSKLGQVAKNRGLSIVTANVESYKSEEQFDIVLCTHSFPYYKDQKKAMKDLWNFVKPGGFLLIANACQNTCYDKVALALVELTTSRAHYPSKEEMVRLIGAHTKKYKVISINKWYIPSIQLFMAKKDRENQ